jgi:hypothetical protein
VEFPCSKFRATFLGADLKSLALEKSFIVLKHFSIHLTQQAAIDEQLFEYNIQAPIGQKVSENQQHLLHQSFAQYKNAMTNFIINKSVGPYHEEPEHSIASFAVIVERPSERHCT